MSGAMLLVGDSETNQNLYYKTRFLAGDPFIYYEIDGRRLLVVSPMEHGRAQKESIVPEVQTFDDFGYTDMVRESKDPAQSFSQVLRKIVDGSGDPVRVQATFPVLYADQLRQAGVELAIETKLLSPERRRKSEEEIQAIEEAQRATERAAALAIDIVRASEDVRGILHFKGIPLTSERLSGEIELSLTRDGFDPSTPVVAGGPGAADPHWRGSGPLRAGEAIVIDIFPRSKSTRYFADMTRTVVRGEPHEPLQAMYDAVVAALDCALGTIKAGVSGKEVHEAALKTLRSHGFQGDTGPRMNHGTGHGVGLDIHEGPSLGVTDLPLAEGDVVTVEPGLYDPAIGGVRVEDLVVVTAEGYRNLTRFSREFRI
jgi:Xaa-Pro aminopeptidase